MRMGMGMGNKEEDTGLGYDGDCWTAKKRKSKHPTKGNRTHDNQWKEERAVE